MNESPSKTGTWKCKHMQHINKYKSININSFHVVKNSEKNLYKKIMKQNGSAKTFNSIFKTYLC